MNFFGETLLFLLWIVLKRGMVRKGGVITIRGEQSGEFARIYGIRSGVNMGGDIRPGIKYSAILIEPAVSHEAGIDAQRNSVDFAASIERLLDAFLNDTQRSRSEFSGNAKPRRMFH
jgi:hypothetical protein